MKEKVNRLSAIKELLEKELISSQEELLSILKRQGFDLTQATLSRDMKQLKVSKVPHPERGYIYKTAQFIDAGRNKMPQGNMFSEYFKSMEFSGNIAVIRTFSGYANSLAITLDSQNLFEILGTIAGDDTIIIALREGVSQRQVKQSIINKFPGLKGKL